jgi:DNA-binding MarR family transcriptional regulator
MARKPHSGDHAALVRALNLASRETGGLGTLLSATVARRMGIAQSDLECIDVIWVHGRMTAGELARAIGLTTGAVTGVIDRLEKAGFARRERDPADRRKVYVSILPQTIAGARRYYGRLEKRTNALIASYSDKEIALILDYFARSRDILRREIARLDAAGNPPPARAPRRAAGAAPRPARRGNPPRKPRG